MSQQWELSARPPGTFHTLGDLWRHRKLLGFIGDRALRKTYRRTILGWVWLLIIPLFPLALRALIFGALLGVSSSGIPYFLFLVAGTIVWDAFATSLTWGTRSIEMNRHLTEAMYMPRAILPVGNMTPAFVDLGIKIVVFLLAVGYYYVRDGRSYVRSDVELAWAAAALLLAFLFALALSFFTSVWGETGRDARFALGQVLAVWYLLTPVLYPIGTVPAAYRGWMLLNPLAIVAETFRWGVFGTGELQPRPFAITAGAVTILLLAGMLYFARAEARAVDER